MTNRFHQITTAVALTLLSTSLLTGTAHAAGPRNESGAITAASRNADTNYFHTYTNSIASLKVKLKLNPWRELIRPNCAGDDCLDADYKTHKKKQEQLEKERKRLENNAAKQRQTSACKNSTTSGTAHTTSHCI